MAEHGRIAVSLSGNKFKMINHVFLGQGIFEHHNFEVSIPMDTMVKVHDDQDPFPVLKDAIGKDIEITFGVATGGDESGQNESSVFKGVVQDVSVIGNDWKHAQILLKGASPTILMDGVVDSQSFSEKDINGIFDECISKHLSSKIKKIDNITYTEKIRFTTQYRESDFDYVKRLCYQYGEWFYYNGEALCLGLETSSGGVTLKKNRVRSLQFDYSVTPGVSGIRYRDYKKHEVAEASAEKGNSNDDMASFGISESDNLFPGEPSCFTTLPSFASGDEMQNEETQLKQILSAQKRAKTAGILIVTGETDNASLKLGGTIKLEGFHHSGEFTIISVNHICNDSNSYSNNFAAIPKGFSYPKMPRIKQPIMDSCVAMVSDNNDPKKWGRVRVKFDWSPDSESPWVRVVTPHAGDKRGLYFIPEIGDEVMVGFEYGHPDSPFVIGSLYNGKNFQEAAYNGDNDFKVIRTKSGNEILFDDSGRMVFRNQNNTIELICKDDGKIIVETNGDLEVMAGKNIAISAGMNITMSAGQNFDVTVGKDYSVNIDGNGEIASSKDLTLSASSNLEAKAGMDLKLSGGQNGELSAMKTKIEGSATAELTSSAATTVKGGIVKIN